MSISIPLVGMHFRPPAKEVLSILPLGFPLEIRPEPTNQYDVNAVMVLVDMADLPVNLIPLLDNILSPMFDACELCSNGPLQLGYLAATGMKTARGGPGNTNALMLISVNGLETIQATLGSAPEGYPVVTISVKS
jgi:hypothetical protein